MSYYTYFLTRRLGVDHDVSVVLMRRLIPRVLYPGRDRVGAQISPLRTGDLVPTFDGVDWTLVPSLWRAARFVVRQQPEVVVLQWWSVTNLIAYSVISSVARRRGARVVLEMHEGIETAEARIPVLPRVSRWGLTRLVRHADWCVVHSAHDRDEFAAEFGVSVDRVAVIPLGPFDVAADVTISPVEREETVIRLLFFGTIRPYKGLEDLVDAFDALPRAEVRWRLLVVGETWEGWTLPFEKIAASPHRADIEVVNRYVTDAEVPELFARSDLVVLPYLRSSASGPLHLAMARGYPVVVTDVGGLREAVDGYDGAVTVPPGNPAALRDGIAAAARLVGVTFEDPHSWDRTAAAFDDVFASIDPR